MSSDRTSSPAGPVDALSDRFKRTELLRGPFSLPGREVVEVYTEIPAGVASGWHTHPGEEIGYVVAGTVEFAVEGRPTVILRAGDPFLVPPRTPHNARVLGAEVNLMVSAYIVDPREPLTTVRR